MQPARASSLLARAGPILVALVAMGVLCAPALDPGTQLFFRDTGRLYYPVKRYIAERLAHGQLAFWDPWTEAGTSLLAQVTPGLLHPLTLLYSVFPFDLAFKLNHLLALPLAAAGLYLFARRLGASPWPACAGGIAYGGSGYLVSMAGSNLPFALGLATIPWALWGLLRFLEAAKAGRLALAAALLALCAYAGDPQSMLFAGLIGTAWALASAIPAGLRAVLRGGALSALWGVTALLLSGPVAVPAAARLTQTSRYAGISKGDLARFENDPIRLAGVLVPLAFDDEGDQRLHGRMERRSRFEEIFPSSDAVAFSASILIGPPALLLALVAARRRRGAFLLLGALVLVLASAGSALGLYAPLLALVPGFRFFRFAEKMMGPASLLICAAAALGAELALSGERRPARLLTALSGAAALVFLLASGLARSWLPAATRWATERGATHDPVLARSFATQLGAGVQLAGLLCLALALAALLRASRDHAASAVLGALACAASAVVGARAALPSAPIELLHEPAPLAEELVRLAGPSEGRWRIYSRVNSEIHLSSGVSPQLAREVGASHALMPQYEVLSRVEGIAPYFSALDEEYAKAMTSFPSRLFRVLNVRFAVFPYFDMDPEMARTKGFALLGSTWVKQFKPEPRAFLVDGGQAIALAEAGKKLADRRFDVLKTALLPAASTALAQRFSPLGSGDAGTAELRTPRPERLEVEVDAKRDALLVLSVHFDRGWRALVDGVPVPPERVDLTVLGVPVGAGRHQIVLKFVPEGLATGVLLLLGGLAALAVGALHERRR